MKGVIVEFIDSGIRYGKIKDCIFNQYGCFLFIEVVVDGFGNTKTVKVLREKVKIDEELIDFIDDLCFSENQFIVPSEK